MRKQVLLSASAALAVAAAAAVTTTVASASAGQTSRTDPQTSPMMRQDPIALHAMPRGNVRFVRGMNDGLVVSIAASGFTPGSVHDVDIERGSCPATFRLGADVAQPEQVQASSDGQIDQTIEVGLGAEMLPRGPLAFTIRQGLTAKVMDGGSNPIAVQGLACVAVPHRIGPHGTRRWLMATSESGMPMSGTASYAYNATDPQSPTGQSVTVTIDAGGFVPGSVHAAHVHAGTCSNQGRVVVMLPDLTADASGHISAADTMPVQGQPQGPLYINIHEGDGNQILSGGMPTLAFRPLLCGDVSQTSETPQPSPVPVQSGMHW
jgi:hypothetical protein